MNLSSNTSLFPRPDQRLKIDLTAYDSQVHTECILLV